MSDKLVIDPYRVYEINGQVCPVQSVYKGVTVATNQTVIAAITGKRIRVMGVYAVASGAGNPTVGLLDGSGGTVRWATTLPAYTVGPVFLPIVQSGYFETTVGVGLFANGTVANSDLTVFYVEYTP